jgi:hypothetical protein
MANVNASAVATSNDVNVPVGCHDAPVKLSTNAADTRYPSVDEYGTNWSKSSTGLPVPDQTVEPDGFPPMPCPCALTAPTRFVPVSPVRFGFAAVFDRPVDDTDLTNVDPAGNS